MLIVFYSEPLKNDKKEGRGKNELLNDLCLSRLLCELAFSVLNFRENLANNLEAAGEDGLDRMGVLFQFWEEDEIFGQLYIVRAYSNKKRLFRDNY